jgi:hypothetical protein
MLSGWLQPAKLYVRNRDILHEYDMDSAGKSKGGGRGAGRRTAATPMPVVLHCWGAIAPEACRLRRSWSRGVLSVGTYYINWRQVDG